MTVMGIRLGATHNLEDAGNGGSGSLTMSDRWDEFSELDEGRHSHRHRWDASLAGTYQRCHREQ